MYNAFAVEHNLVLNSLHDITHKSIETKQKLESLLTIIDDLQFSDIPKLREDIKQFLVSINDISCDGSHNINKKKKKNDNSDQIFVANDISINNDMNGFSYNKNNNEIIETIETKDNNNNDIKHDTVSNDNNIVDVYVATIPRHHDARKNDTIDNDSNINTNNYNIILMNELNNALQLISFTERINKFDDENNQNDDNNDENDNNNNDSYTNEKELPLQLHACVAFDLQRRLSEMNKSSTCNTIHE